MKAEAWKDLDISKCGGVDSEFIFYALCKYEMVESSGHITPTEVSERRGK